jgi:hypothetical protein
MKRALCSLALAIALTLGLVGTPTPASADWADGDNTSSPYALCSWTGVRDGVLGISGTSLVRYYDFVYYGDHWVGCRARISSGTFVGCHNWIIDRDRAHLYSGTYHLGHSTPPC